MSLLAVHISDGVLPLWPWVVGGFALASVLVGMGCFRIRDAEVPMLALMTAAFFVGSQVHIGIGPTSVHLLLNGLAGVLLGVRAGLAIAIGLLLQAVMFGHGGFTALGVNICIMAIPALAAVLAYRALAARIRRGRTAFRLSLTFLSVLSWLLAAAFGILWIAAGRSTTGMQVWLTIGCCMAISLAAAWLEQKAERHPAFPLGLFLGTAAALATVGLNVLTLALVLPPDAKPLAAAILLAHLPIAAIEGWMVATVIAFLERVAPQLLPETGIYRQ